ncbi:right-handed parallel beta-helix repeat-containing protein [Calothrix sp. FACHB-1219]|uniref:SdrD B-like domain-containing protein n=1 Tax=unclassified Calothrix TaxID=2619626 RepID=UPI001687CC3A|nr:MULTISPECIES: SdrD B-like domain-containing protein [unclassified Calothrix]MBD2206730.1 right-handed parallel beta-helix repeat-containing protein [Calothrix sp. FACHB-168]MBD2219720.1 right-handed parallel beta-helix repeat-containing protein [Calothrix sp. FACHB-1219]
MAIINVSAGQSIQQAINAAKNGDTIIVAPGVYRETLTISGKAITLASEFLTTGDSNAIMTTIIDGGGSLVDSDPDVVRFTDTVPPGAKLIGFTVRNGGDGIKVEGTKVDILNNYITNTIDGINYKLVSSGVSGGIARNNIIEKNKDDGVDINQVADVVVEDNIIRQNGNDGIEVRMNSYTGTTVLNNIIRRNIISANNGDGIQLIDYPEVSQRYYRIENNLIEGNRDAGLGLMDNGDSSEDYRAASIPEPIDVIGNTFKNNNHGLTGGDNLVAINNIFINHTRIAMKGVDGNSIAAYNLFWNNGTNTQGSNVDTSTTIFADPLLSTTSELQTGSPAIDKGTALFQWRGRTVIDLPSSSYKGSAPDLGAFESGSTSQPQPQGSIGNRIWNDTDGDGIQDAEETGIANVSVKLLNSSQQIIATKLTNSNGHYTFNNLSAGTYTVQVDSSTLPSGAQITSDPDATKDGQSVVSLATDETKVNIDFGYKFPLQPPQPKVIEVRVNSSSDDAEQRRTTGSMNLTSTDLELINDSVDQLVGLRFVGVNIPQGAKITNAYIQFKVDEIGSTATNLTIRGEDVDNALTFTTSKNNISSRVTTDAAVVWNPLAWSTVSQAGINQRTANIASVIQEIVDRQGWSSGNSIATIISGTGKRTAESYDGDALGAPLLYVEFTSPTSSSI